MLRLLNTYLFKQNRRNVGEVLGTPLPNHSGNKGVMLLRKLYF